jgi:hypothetical protein
MKFKTDFSKWPLVLRITTILFGGISLLWLGGIMIQFLNAIKNHDFSMFYEYGTIALTVFSFTLIGGIFEKNKSQSRIVKQLFDSSLSFLITAISFYFMYSLSSFFTNNTISLDTTQNILFVGAFSIAQILGFSGIIMGLLNLYRILVSYRIELEKKD